MIFDFKYKDKEKCVVYHVASWGLVILCVIVLNFIKMSEIIGFSFLYLLGSISSLIVIIKKSRKLKRMISKIELKESSIKFYFSHTLKDPITISNSDITILDDSDSLSFKCISKSILVRTIFKEELINKEVLTLFNEEVSKLNNLSHVKTQMIG